MKKLSLVLLSVFMLAGLLGCSASNSSSASVASSSVAASSSSSEAASQVSSAAASQTAEPSAEQQVRFHNATFTFSLPVETSEEEGKLTIKNTDIGQILTMSRLDIGDADESQYELLLETASMSNFSTSSISDVNQQTATLMDRPANFISCAVSTNGAVYPAAALSFIDGDGLFIWFYFDAKMEDTTGLMEDALTSIVFDA